MFMKDSSFGAERSCGHFIGGSKKRELGGIQCGRQVHGPGIVGDEEIASAQEAN